MYMPIYSRKSGYYGLHLVNLCDCFSKLKYCSMINADTSLMCPLYTFSYAHYSRVNNCGEELAAAISM